MSWIFLSYELNDKAFGYGNGDRFALSNLSQMAEGDTCNNTRFSMPSHYGTHIDFPFHFDIEGKKSSDFDACHFVSDKVSLIEVQPSTVVDHIMTSDSFSDVVHCDPETEILLIKTGFCYKRYTEEYWNYGWGPAPETANFLKQQLPNLRCIILDQISLNSYQNRLLGRESHKEYLSKNDILIVEDADFSRIDRNTHFNQIIIAPLRIENVDGVPVTLFAEID